jgi:hypothetical protein
MVALPPSSNGKERAIQERRRFKQIDPLDKRLAEEADAERSPGHPAWR